MAFKVLITAIKFSVVQYYFLHPQYTNIIACRNKVEFSYNQKK